MNIDSSLRSLALLTTRLTLGGSIAMHGAQKMFGIQGGPGLKGAAGFMEQLGFKPGNVFAPMLAAGEMTSGTLISLGALGPVGPALLLTIMAVAVETVHRPKGYWNDKGGFEMNTMYVLNALMLANEGYGEFSLDEMLGWRKHLRPMHGWLSMVAGVAAALLILSLREQQGAPTATVTKDETITSESMTSAAV